MDPKLLIEAAFAVAAFFSAIWIKGVRDELRGIAEKVNNHGERLAVLESRVDRVEDR
jgi:hypothetical protein